MSARERLALRVTLATVAFLVVLGANVVAPERAAAAYFVTVGALLVHHLVVAAGARLGRVETSPFDIALAAEEDVVVRPPELVRIEREVLLGMENEAYLRERLVPILRAAASARLAAKHGIDLSRRPETARPLLGDVTWQLLQEGRAEVGDHELPGISATRLRAALDALEAL